MLEFEPEDEGPIPHKEITKLLSVFSAKGAASITSLGQRPRNLIATNRQR
jgi:hypothetical protein